MWLDCGLISTIIPRIKHARTLTASLYWAGIFHMRGAILPLIQADVDLLRVDLRRGSTPLISTLHYLTCGFFLMSPSVGTKSPVNNLISVDLPAPFGPTRAMRESRSKPKSRSWMNEWENEWMLFNHSAQRGRWEGPCPSQSQDPEWIRECEGDARVKV